MLWTISTKTGKAIHLYLQLLPLSSVCSILNLPKNLSNVVTHWKIFGILQLRLLIMYLDFRAKSLALEPISVSADTLTIWAGDWI